MKIYLYGNSTLELDPMDAPEIVDAIIPFLTLESAQRRAQMISDESCGEVNVGLRRLVWERTENEDGWVAEDPTMSHYIREADAI